MPIHTSKFLELSGIHVCLIIYLIIYLYACMPIFQNGTGQFRKILHYLFMGWDTCISREPTFTWEYESIMGCNYSKNSPTLCREMNYGNVAISYVFVFVLYHFSLVKDFSNGCELSLVAAFQTGETECQLPRYWLPYM